MNGFAELNARASDALKRRLENCADPKEAADRACQWVDELRSEYLKGLSDSGQAERVNALCAAAKAGLIALGAVNGAEAECLPALRRRNWRDMASYMPAALSGVLAVWLLLLDQMSAAALALVCASSSLLFARERAHAAPAQDRLRARPRVDCAELLRRLEFLFAEIDQLISGAPAPEPDCGALPRTLLAPMQMLMEAQLTGDGDFALRSMPQLVDALSRQGLTISMYTEESRLDFDLLPAETGGETIRPALRMDGQLIARGQATVKA